MRLAALLLPLACLVQGFVACKSGPAPTKTQPSAEPAATTEGWKIVASARLDPFPDAGPGESYTSETIRAPDAGAKKDAGSAKH